MFVSKGMRNDLLPKIFETGVGVVSHTMGPILCQRSNNKIHMIRFPNGFSCGRGSTEESTHDEALDLRQKIHTRYAPLPIGQKIGYVGPKWQVH